MAGPNEAELLRGKVSIQGAAQVSKGIGDIRRETAAASKESRSGADSLNRHARAAREASIQADKLGAVAIGRGSQGLRRMRQDADQTTASLRKLAKANEEANRSSVFRRGAQGAAALALGVGVQGAYRGILSTVKAFEAGQGNERAFRFQLGAGGGARALADSRAFADRYGLDFGGVRQTALGLAGTGKIDAKSIVKVLEAFNALGTLGGASSEEIIRALVQLKQIASNGKVQGDELNSINEAGIPLRKLLSDAGYGPRIGSQTDPIRWEEVQSALLKFGEDPKTKQALAESTDRATRSLGELNNTLQYDVLPAVGEVLSPALKGAADTLNIWADELDPATVQAWTKGLLEATPSLIALGVGAKLVKGGFDIVKTYLQWKFIGSATAASLALDKLAVSATVASFAPGGGVGGAAGKAAKGVGHLIGPGGVRQVFGHSVGTAAGAGAAAGGGAAAKGVGHLIGPGGVRQVFGHSVATAAAGATGGGGIAALGGATVPAVLGGGAVAIAAGMGGLAAIAAVEALSGRLGKEDSIFYRMVGGKGVEDISKEDAYELAVKAKVDNGRRIMKTMFGWKKLPTLEEYWKWNRDEDSAFLLRQREKRRASWESSRRSSMDQWQAESETRQAQRGWTTP